MREHSRDRGRLEDILKYAQNVEQIVNGISYEQFVADIRLYYSVMNEDPYTEIDNAGYKQAIESAQRMKAKGYALDDIVEVTSLTAEEIERL